MRIEYDYNEIIAMLDSTLLRADALTSDYDQLCQEAKDYGFKAVCVLPAHVKHCKKMLKDTMVKVSAVVGYPLGASLTAVKCLEAKKAVKDGADELDYVMPIYAAKAGEWEAVYKEIKKIVGIAKKERVVKVIIEAAYFNDEEIKKACEICVLAGARFAKNSTGYVGAATNELIAAMSKAVGDQLKEDKDDRKRCEVKASGGIKTYLQAKALAESGATRIGTSNALAIYKEAMASAPEKPAHKERGPVKEEPAEEQEEVVETTFEESEDEVFEESPAFEPPAGEDE